MYIFASLVGLCVAVARADPTDFTQYVLTNTGEANGGNTFAGVTLPFGMVKLGPDMYFSADAYSGDATIGNFTGFSMMHESGTGGAPKYGVVSQMPVLGNITNPLDNLNDTRASPDITSIGYYKASLGSKITVELSATSRAGFYQYTFPPGNQSNVVVDVSHVLPSYRGQGLSQQYLGGNITTSNNHYEGHGDYDNGWNRAPDWRIYFCGYFDTPATVQTFVGQNDNGSILAQYSTASNVNSTTRVGAVFNFNTAINVTSRVGISFISTAQACNNVNTQIPEGTTLLTLTNSAKQVWNDEVLSKVTTTEPNLSNLQLLYSSMYFMHLLPSNRTGENPLWTSSEPYYDDTFTTWDLFRCTFSLLQVFQPSMYEEYIRSLIDIFRFEGYMPDARSSNFNGASQGGSNSDNVLADAYVKGVRGAVNWTAGYEAMLKNAEVTPPNNNDPRDPSSSTKEGRGALPDWLEHGYITPTYGRSVTRAVEYSVNDFSLSQVAAGLGKTADVQKYIHRSRNWRNHWNPNATSLNFTGFLVPRTSDGFLTQDPLSCGGCYWGDAYYEALPWEYSFNAHHDINTLIALSGGPSTFVSRLDTMFKPDINTSGRSAQFNNTIFNPGNEPSFTTPYLYNYVNRQDLSVEQSRNIAKSYYSPTPGGLPGNSDAGAMESWLLWNMLGLYPMVGQTTFLIGSPWFANTSLSLGSSKQLTITTTGGSNESYYVQSLQVNGIPWTQSWVTWDEIFANGGSMAFVLGPEPRNWTEGGALPPSPASEFQQTSNPTTIVNPAKVTILPSLAVLEREERRRALLRDVGLGVMGFVVLVLGIMAGCLWWFWLRKAKRAATGDQDEDREKGGNVLETPVQMGWGLRRTLNGSQDWLRKFFTKKQPPLQELSRPKSADDSIGGSTIVDTDTSQPNNGKKELRVSVLEAFYEPDEPWTPRGTNRRINGIPEENRDG